MPDESLPPPDQALSFQTHSLMLKKQNTSEPTPLPVAYIHEQFPLMKPTDPERSTHVMAILNVTPDSFSDGGRHFEQDVNSLIKTISGYIQAGATIIDVGGQSTRPNALTLGPKEEINRVVPVIKLIRSLPEARNIAISVDTFYARVAKAAIDAGADIINDISGGSLDPEMFSTAAASGKTIVISHTRGDPKTMNKFTFYEDGVVAGVAAELTKSVEAALAAGVRPWRIILDPGIGFAKTGDQNLELLRDLDRLRNTEGLQGYPWLLGTSRKKFIGTITGVEVAEDRVFGTAATVTASIREGADIIRVHDVEQMSQVVKMSDAIYRNRRKDPVAEKHSPEQRHGTATSTPEVRNAQVPQNPILSILESGKRKNQPKIHLLLGDDAVATDGLNTFAKRPR